MEIKTKEKDQLVIVKFAGNLDTNTAPKADKHLKEILKEGHVKILVDFEDLDYMSSAGLRVLLSAAKEVQGKKGGVGICSMNDEVRQVLEMTGLAGLVFKVFQNEEEGLAKL
jgi:anti-sigma B factor antagonist